MSAPQSHKHQQLPGARGVELTYCLRSGALHDSQASGDRKLQLIRSVGRWLGANKLRAICHSNKAPRLRRYNAAISYESNVTTKLELCSEELYT